MTKARSNFTTREAAFAIAIKQLYDVHQIMKREHDTHPGTVGDEWLDSHLSPSQEVTMLDRLARIHNKLLDESNMDGTPIDLIKETTTVTHRTE